MSQDQPESELYRRLMAIKPDDLTRNAWAVQAGVNRSVFGDIRRNGRAKHETIEKLVNAVGVSWAEFDAAGAPQPATAEGRPRFAAPEVRYDAHRGPRLSAMLSVPVMGTAHGSTMHVGDNGIEIEQTLFEPAGVIDHVRCPAAIEGRRDIFAVWVQGDSMEPRYEAGDLAYIDPLRPPAIGDYVMVQLREPETDGDDVVSVLIKRLVRRSADYVQLEQFNPPAMFSLETDRIHSILRIIPMRELLGY